MDSIEQLLIAYMWIRDECCELSQTILLEIDERDRVTDICK